MRTRPTRTSRTVGLVIGLFALSSCGVDGGGIEDAVTTPTPVGSLPASVDDPGTTVPVAPTEPGTGVDPSLPTNSDDPVENLEPGDCFEKVGAPEDTLVEEVPCDQPHTFEVYAAWAHPDGEFPGDEEIRARSEEGCLARYEAFTGEPYETSAYSAGQYRPTVLTWSKLDDRTVYCYLWHEGEELTSSVRAN